MSSRQSCPDPVTRVAQNRKRVGSATTSGSCQAAPAVVSMVTALIVIGQVGYNAQHGIPWTQAAGNGNAATPAEYAAAVASGRW